MFSVYIILGVPLVLGVQSKVNIKLIFNINDPRITFVQNVDVRVNIDYFVVLVDG